MREDAETNEWAVREEDRVDEERAPLLASS